MKLIKTPIQLIEWGEQEILVHLRKAVKRAVGLSKIKELKKVVVAPIGIREGYDMAKLELRTLIDKIGKDTVAGFFSEVGDLSYYYHPKQIIKLAGLSLKENTSGKHKGQSKITKRGWKFC